MSDIVQLELITQIDERRIHVQRRIGQGRDRRNASDCVVSVGPIRATYGASIWIVVPDGRCGGCVSKV